MPTNTSAHSIGRRHYVLYAHDTIHSCFSQGSENVILISPPQHTGRQATQKHTLLLAKQAKAILIFQPEYNVGK